MGTSAAGSDGTAGESAGLAITSQGTITFNQAAFEAAYAKNPTAVQAMFTEGGTFTPASPPSPVRPPWTGPPTTRRRVVRGHRVPVRGAGRRHRFDHLVRADVRLSAAETYTVTSGSATATYAAAAGESITDVISGLNSAPGQRRHRGLGRARRFRRGVPGPTGHSRLRISGHLLRVGLGRRPARPDERGVHLQRASTSPAPSTAWPRPAIGQDLSLLSTGDPANGLVVAVTATGITTPTALGTINYAPGFAQGLAHLAKTSSLAPSGLVPETIAGLQGTLSEVDSEITMQQQLVATQQAALTQEFTNLEATLSKLQATSSFLNAQAGTSSSSSLQPRLGEHIVVELRFEFELTP